jgi:DNA-binding winged helix-turn-helix (wHTH) protein
MRVRFGPFTINSRTRQLLQGEREVHLSPKAFDLLHVLIERSPDLVTKDELLRHIWQDAFVIEANLNVLVREVRQAIGDSAQEPRFVQTVHGRGFRFCAEVTPIDVRPTLDTPGGFWLVIRERTFVLADGENVIGRDPRCQIWIDEAGVSRRHAAVHIDRANRVAMLRDLDSTNGTFVGASRVTSTVQLSDGDVVTIGPIELTYREWSNSPTERTAPPRSR